MPKPPGVFSAPDVCRAAPFAEIQIIPIQTCAQRGVAIVWRDMEHELVKHDQAIDFYWADRFQIDPAAVFATSGKPLTWLPLGGLVEQAQRHSTIAEHIEQLML